MSVDAQEIQLAENNVDYRSTLNLPQTSFAMQAELTKKEPARVAWWKEHDIYEKRLAANEENPTWILHDGPPYANGEVHMGTFLNRVLKDIFIKLHLLDGKRANFTPGWDMHGLPIEFETLKHLKLNFHDIDPIELRAKCRERAIYWLERQRATFLRMGVLGDYDHPYRTIDKEFETEIVRTLAELAGGGQLYKSLRPTLWCVKDETALAEAEIEYADKTSTAVYVRFPASAEQRVEFLDKFGLAQNSAVPQRVSVGVWTTTPWTLPANIAVALNPDAVYGLYVGGGEGLILADELAANVFNQTPSLATTFNNESLTKHRVAGATGKELAGTSVRHPLYDRDSMIVTANYVDLRTGTGAVHTAPAHGVEDFETGKAYGLPTLLPVDKAGLLTKEAGEFAGQHIFKAGTAIIAALERSGNLITEHQYEHSYPHCWRCKSPVIFRATSQWFISMDANDLRTKASTAAEAVSWHPDWGMNRMKSMLEHHPEWCISRQRTWGTPIPAVRCIDCQTSVLDPQVARNTAERFAETGADVWWTDDVKTFLPKGFACKACAGTTFEKEFDIVDIWFESGVTHRVVLGKNDDKPWPADLIIEGADQFRGWFRSSLLTGVATKGGAPYKEVLTTGWVVDANGHAMHKSKNNFIAAESAMSEYGADILRLWIASVEFTNDMRIGKDIIKSVSGTYRGLRNRLRWMLGTLGDFEQADILRVDELEEVDRLAVMQFTELANSVVEDYKAYKLHNIYLSLMNFDASDMSAFYVNVLKDRLYSSAKNSKARRSAQTALFTIFQGLVTLYAPILSFTAEEAWQALPENLKDKNFSVFDLALPQHQEVSAKDKAAWEFLKEMRSQASTHASAREFQVDAIVTVAQADQMMIEKLGESLREALIVSQVNIVHTPTPPAVTTLRIIPASGEKCERCWRYETLTEDSEHPKLCKRCLPIVKENK